jgi:hypothetical protein
MDRQIKREKMEEDKRMKQEEQRKRHVKARIVMSKKKPLHTWTKTDYKTVLMAMKTKGDAKLPDDIESLQNLFDKWKDRGLGTIVMEDSQEMDKPNINQGHHIVMHENHLGVGPFFNTGSV